MASIPEGRPHGRPAGDLYAVALVGVSATSPARSLTTGEWKCFDDWCASVTSAVRTGDLVQVDLAVQNRGRGEQAPHTPRLWLVHHGRRDMVVLAGLAQLEHAAHHEVPAVFVAEVEAFLRR